MSCHMLSVPMVRSMLLRRFFGSDDYCMVLDRGHSAEGIGLVADPWADW